MPIAKLNIRDYMKKKEPSFIPTEHDEQVSLFHWAEVAQKAYPELRYMFAIPNGGKRHPYVAKKMKDEGVKPGVPDLFLPVSRENYHGLFIEMKRTVGGSISKPQKEFIGHLMHNGYRVCVCAGVHEAISEILKYLENTNEKK